MLKLVSVHAFYLNSTPFTVFAMPNRPSEVSKKLEKRDVLLADGGKDALRKKPAAANRRPNEMHWAKVVAPAYISGSPHYGSLIAYCRSCITITCIIGR